MKGKQFIFFLALLNVSCRVTEKNVMGFYKSDQNGDQQALWINRDHTFLYADDNFINDLVKHYNTDSCHFINRGIWKLDRNELILNSYNRSFDDTNRMRKLAKNPTKSKESNFSFRNIYHDTIPFYRIDDEKGNFAFIFDKTYSDYNVELFKHKTLTFYLGSYKPWLFVIKDTTNANYVITLAPYYKQEYFKNKILAIKMNRLRDNKVKFKKDKTVNYD